MDYHLAVTDGGKRGDITYGSYKVYDPYGCLLHTRQLVYGFGTSSASEYLTALHALRYCSEIGIKDLVLITDSDLLVNQVKGVYAINHEHLKELVRLIRKVSLEFNTVEIKKVSRNIIKSQLGH